MSRHHAPTAVVPMTTRWWVDGDTFLGRCAIRHHLTPFLRELGRPPRLRRTPRRPPPGPRHRDAARRLPIAHHELGIDPVLVTCDDTNTGSRKVIEACGGIFEDQRGEKLRYWIADRRRTAARQPPDMEVAGRSRGGHEPHGNRPGARALRAGRGLSDHSGPDPGADRGAGGRRARADGLGRSRRPPAGAVTGARCARSAGPRLAAARPRGRPRGWLVEVLTPLGLARPGSLASSAGRWSSARGWRCGGTSSCRWCRTGRLVPLVWLYRQLLTPLGHGIAGCSTCCWRRCGTAYRRLLAPLGRVAAVPVAGQRAVRVAVGGAVAVCAGAGRRRYGLRGCRWSWIYRQRPDAARPRHRLAADAASDAARHARAVARGRAGGRPVAVRARRARRAGCTGTSSSRSAGRSPRRSGSPGGSPDTSPAPSAGRSWLPDLVGRPVRWSTGRLHPVGHAVRDASGVPPRRPPSRRPDRPGRAPAPGTRASATDAWRAPVRRAPAAPARANRRQARRRVLWVVQRLSPARRPTRDLPARRRGEPGRPPGAPVL